MVLPLERRLSAMEQAIDDLTGGLFGLAVGPGSLNGQMIAPKSINAGSLNVQTLQSVTAKTGNLSVSGAITVGTGGSIGSGQTAYNTGTGFWIESNAGTPRMSIGNSAGNRLVWSGSTLTIVGNVQATSGQIGGWTIGATTLTGGDVTLDSANGVIFNSTGAYGDAVTWKVSGSPVGSIYGSGGGIHIESGNGASGANSTWSGNVLSLVGNGANLYIGLTSGGVSTDGRIYPGNGNTQSTGYIDWNATASTVRIPGNFEVNGGYRYSGMFSSGGSGALPNPTKYMTMQDAAGTVYYLPAYSSHANWTS